MMQIVWLPEAEKDLERLYEFIRPINPKAAKRALLVIIDGVDRLLEFPELGRPRETLPRIRELIVPFGARAYIVRYRLTQDSVVIVRIFHGLEDRQT